MNVYEEIRERTEVAEMSSAAERGWTHSELLINDVRFLLEDNEYLRDKVANPALGYGDKWKALALEARTERDRLRKELEEEKEHCTKAIRLLMQVTDTLSFGRTPDRAGAALKQIYKWLEENKSVGQEGEGNQDAPA